MSRFVVLSFLGIALLGLLSCGGRQLQVATTCANASTCGEEELCLEGHCLPEYCGDITDCPWGFGCRNGQCEAAECSDVDPAIANSQARPCPEEYQCVYANELSRTHGDGLCDEIPDALTESTSASE